LLILKLIFDAGNNNSLTGELALSGVPTPILHNGIAWMIQNLEMA
jgi:hypothetical protein